MTLSDHATTAAVAFLGAAVLTLQGVRFGLWLADYHSNVRTWKTVRRPAASRIERLIDWSTDPKGMDREALENIDRDGWDLQS